MGKFDFITTAGCIGLDPATGKLKETLEEQVEQALTNLKNLLEDNGSSLDDVVRTQLFILVSQPLSHSLSRKWKISQESMRSMPSSLPTKNATQQELALP